MSWEKNDERRNQIWVSGAGCAGMAEMMGVEAVAGHLLISTLVSGLVAGGTEMTSATVEADGKRLADRIVQDLENFFIDQGWIWPDAVKKSMFWR
jgi:hypothetical protein